MHERLVRLLAAHDVSTKGQTELWQLSTGLDAFRQGSIDKRAAVRAVDCVLCATLVLVCDCVVVLEPLLLAVPSQLAASCINRMQPIAV